MIEVALALGIVAIGVISIMALFPIGLAASRDAMTENYSSDAADQLIHQLEFFIRQPTGWTDYVTAGTPRIPAAEPAKDDIPFTQPPLATEVAIDGTSGTLFNSALTAANTTTDGRYKIIRYSDKNANNTFDAGTDLVDFEAILVVWQSTVEIPSAGGNTMVPNTAATRLHVEASWPARVPYAQRTKSYFTKEFFKR